MEDLAAALDADADVVHRRGHLVRERDSGLGGQVDAEAEVGAVEVVGEHGESLASGAVVPFVKCSAGWDAVAGCPAPSPCSEGGRGLG